MNIWEQRKGDNLSSTLVDGPVDDGSVENSGKVTQEREKVTGETIKGDTAMSPDPSLPVNRPAGVSGSTLSSQLTAFSSLSFDHTSSWSQKAK